MSALGRPSLILRTYKTRIEIHVYKYLYSRKNAIERVFICNKVLIPIPRATVNTQCPQRFPEAKIEWRTISYWPAGRRSGRRSGLQANATSESEKRCR